MGVMMPVKHMYTQEALEMDIFLPEGKKLLVKNALTVGKSVTIEQSSFSDPGSDYSDISIDGELIYHQIGY